MSIHAARANWYAKHADNPRPGVYFLVGGTQTNTTVIDGLLAHHEGVLAAETAHINVHEAGAIEASGHKVLTLPQHEGKLRADEVEAYLTRFYNDETYEHMVAPGMVYISHPTEYGTLYSLHELEALSSVCRKANIPLYMDGARLGYGLSAPDTDVTLKDIARLCDVFYIGGTKVGALFGEAVVAPRPNFSPISSRSSSSTAPCWPREGCWAFSSRHCFPTDCTSVSARTPYAWP